MNWTQSILPETALNKKESQQTTIREKERSHFISHCLPLLTTLTRLAHLLDSKLLLQEEHSVAYSVSQDAET